MCVTSSHANRLAGAVVSLRSFTFFLYDIIQEIRPFYSVSQKRLRSLRKSFVQELRGKQSNRVTADNWRCIEYAMLHEVPKRHFCITNKCRMIEKMSRPSSSESEDSESDSSTYQAVIDSPLIEDAEYFYAQNDIPASHYPLDDNFDGLDESHLLTVTSGNGDLSSKSGKQTKARKRRKV